MQKRPMKKKKSLLELRRIVVGLLGPLVLLAVFPVPAGAYPRPGITDRVSVASDGAQADSYSFWFSTISPDGRHVAFSSHASNLVPGDTNGTLDIFVHDQATGATARVSVSSGGAEANADAVAPAISADGRYVAFASWASNLVPGDTNGGDPNSNDGWDIFVHDRSRGTTERVSVTSGGAEANSWSYAAAISADGRHVAFWSPASNLVPGDTNTCSPFIAIGSCPDVFVHDRETGTTERVSVTSGGAQGNADSWAPAISADGRHVAFVSAASNLVSGDTGIWDIFVHDRATGTTERVSATSGGAEGDAESFDPAISADGRYVAFPSYATDLVPVDTNFNADIFMHDRATGTTERVSVTSDGAQANNRSSFPVISADGRYVAFQSRASNLVPGDTNGTYGLDVFLYDRVAGATERVSVAPDGAEANSWSDYPTISADGRHVAFISPASNLVPGDTNGGEDVFVHDRGGSLGIVGTPSVLTVPGGVDVSGRASFSGALSTAATDPGDDATGMGPVEAADVGAELTGASLVYRPEQEDLLLRLDLSSLPSDPAGTYAGLAPGAGGFPGVLYGAELLEDRVRAPRYEVRAIRAAAAAAPPRAPYVALYRCDPDCTEHAPLKGSFGTTGKQIRVSVPLSALGVTEGAQLAGLRAFTAAGEAAPGAVHLFDEVPLSSSVLPARGVELGIAPASTPMDQVAFTVDADLLAGDFSGTIPTAGLSPGTYRVWSRACLGDACGPAEFREVAL